MSINSYNDPRKIAYDLYHSGKLHTYPPDGVIRTIEILLEHEGDKLSNTEINQLAGYKSNTTNLVAKGTESWTLIWDVINKRNLSALEKANNLLHQKLDNDELEPKELINFQNNLMRQLPRQKRESVKRVFNNPEKMKTIIATAKKVIDIEEADA
jgi:hypothetical protein